MNLTIKLRKELTVAVLRDQFGDLIESKKQEISIAVNEKVKKEDAGYSSKIISLAKQGGIIDRLGTCVNVSVSGLNRIRFETFDRAAPEYYICENVNLNEQYVSRYSFYIEQDEKIKQLLKDAAKLRSEWIKTREDLFSVLQSVKTVKKLKELTSVFDPFIPNQSKGTSLIPVEQLLRVNELKTPKNKAAN